MPKTWAYTFDFTRSNGGWEDYWASLGSPGKGANWFPGIGWRRGNIEVSRISLDRIFFVPTTITSITYYLSEPLNGNEKALAALYPAGIKEAGKNTIQVLM